MTDEEYRNIIDSVFDCAALWQADDADDAPEQTAEYDAAQALAREAAALLDALALALPYVEEAQSDLMYKPGSVARVVKTIRAAIAKAGDR